MRVFVAPFFAANRYQELLNDALRTEGVEVCCDRRARPLRLFIVDVVRHDADVFHLHWTHPYFLFGSKEWPYRIPFVGVACAAFAVLFLVQVYLATLFCDRVVWTVHNRLNHERRYPGLDRWVNARVAAMVDSRQVWDERTRGEAARLFDLDPGRFTVVPHGNYLPVHDCGVSRAAARDALDLPHDRRVLLYFGVIRPYKRVPELIETFLDADPDDAILLVAGNPKHEVLRERIEALAAGEERVRLSLRYVPDEEVPTYFAACDAAVVPYEHIFSSGSVLLAMSLGRAFVAPAKGCLPSVDPGGNVLYDDLREGLRRIASLSSERLDAIGDRNIEAARRDHDWREIARRTVALYGGTDRPSKMSESGT